MIKNHYQSLDISKDAKPEEIKKAFRLYASKYHPDKHGGDKFFEEKFKDIKEAYDVLSNPELKRKYDEKLFGKPKQEFSFNHNSKEKYSDHFKEENQSNKNKQTNNQTHYQNKKPKYETPEQKTKREIAERRTKNFFIGIGTAAMVIFLFSAFGDNGMHVPIAMFFVFWTIHQIFVVLVSFLSD